MVTASSGAGPQLYPPLPPLAEYIDYFGYWGRDFGDPHQSRALPRGAATIIIDVGGRQRIDFYAFDASTRLNVPPAFIAGAGTASYITRIDATQAVVTIHFRPGGALPFLGIPLGELENTCVGLTDLWGAEGTTLRERLTTAFRAEVGLAPKAYLRVRRLQAALRRLDTGRSRGSTIAADLGYFDQAHFVREFRAFTAAR